LVDELVQIDDGIYLGQLLLATKGFSLGEIKVPFLEAPGIQVGEAYHAKSPTEWLGQLFDSHSDASIDYGYQNNGFFLMIDPALADRVYAAFPAIRPLAGEICDMPTL